MGILGVPKQKAVWTWPSWKGAKYTIRGKVVASPKLGRGESCVFGFPVVRSNTKNALTMH
jgi:hypothetical protein